MPTKKVNVRGIQLEPYSTGDLVQEVTRAYLHCGNPSALLKRIIQGACEFRAELASADPKIDELNDDYRLAGELIARLDELAKHFVGKENSLIVTG